MKKSLKTAKRIKRIFLRRKIVLVGENYEAMVNDSFYENNVNFKNVFYTYKMKDLFRLRSYRFSSLYYLIKEKQIKTTFEMNIYIYVIIPPRYVYNL